MADPADGELLSEWKDRIYFNKHNPQVKPGFYTNVTNKEYHSGPGISKSNLDHVGRSFNHFLEASKIRKETPSMRKGTALHTALLEPDKFDKEYFISDLDDKRSANFKQQKEICDNDGKIILTASEGDIILRIANGALSNKIARDLLTSDGGIPEGSCYQVHEETDLILRCRPDLLLPDADLIVDLKTTKCASLHGPNNFGRSAGLYHYDKQAAFYSDLMTMQTGRVHDFIFIAVENEPPFNCTVFEMDPFDIEEGRKMYKRNIAKIDFFMKNTDQIKNFGYSDQVELVEIPKYLRREDV